MSIALFLASTPGGGGGDLTHGASFEITGSGFGTKSTAAPLMFETFESGSFHSQWAETPAQATIQTGNQRNARSTRNAWINGYGSDDQHWALDSSPISRDWFIAMWFYLASDWTWGSDVATDPLGNIKVFRMWGPSDPSDESAILVLHSGDWGLFSKGASEIASSAATPSLATWHHLQMEFRDSSSTSATDGHCKVWLDGVQVISVSSVDFRDTSALKRPWDLGFWNSHATSPDDSWQDDTYADTFLARVELGDNAVYASCTHREMQLPTTWSDTSIDITVNCGSFTTGNTVYLHVVDSSGTVQSNVMGSLTVA